MSRARRLAIAFALSLTATGLVAVAHPPTTPSSVTATLGDQRPEAPSGPSPATVQMYLDRQEAGHLAWLRTVSTTTTTTQPRQVRQKSHVAHQGFARVYGGSPGPHPCGPAFDLPPCWVMMRESGGNINAYNPTGCVEDAAHSRDGLPHKGCKGKWQCSFSTCSGVGTEEQQDAEVRPIWNHGAGCSHWAACG